MSSIKRLLAGHEPECYLSHDKTEDGCSVCDAAAAAYMRGREDAAKDTGAYTISNIDSNLETADFLDGLWNAARGGEHK